MTEQRDPLNRALRAGGLAQRVAAGLYLMLAGVPAAFAGEPDILLFSQPDCAACEAAKEFFADRAIGYRELDITASTRAREAFSRLGGRGTPLLIIDQHVIHGFDADRLSRITEGQPRTGSH